MAGISSFVDMMKTISPAVIRANRQSGSRERGKKDGRIRVDVIMVLGQRSKGGYKARVDLLGITKNRVKTKRPRRSSDNRPQGTGKSVRCRYRLICPSYFFLIIHANQLCLAYASLRPPFIPPERVIIFRPALNRHATPLDKDACQRKCLGIKPTLVRRDFGRPSLCRVAADVDIAACLLVLSTKYRHKGGQVTIVFQARSVECLVT